jgi:hypothetical protein
VTDNRFSAALRHKRILDSNTVRWVINARILDVLLSGFGSSVEVFEGSAFSACRGPLAEEV